MEVIVKVFSHFAAKLVLLSRVLAFDLPRPACFLPAARLLCGACCKVSGWQGSLPYMLQTCCASSLPVPLVSCFCNARMPTAVVLAAALLECCNSTMCLPCVFSAELDHGAQALPPCASVTLMHEHEMPEGLGERHCPLLQPALLKLPELAAIARRVSRATPACCWPTGRAPSPCFCRVKFLEALEGPCCMQSPPASATRAASST